MFGLMIRELLEVRNMSQCTKKAGPGRKREHTAGEGTEYWRQRGVGHIYLAGVGE